MENFNALGLIRDTRTQLNGTVEVKVSFDGEPPAWIPIRTLEGISMFIEKTLNTQQAQ
jgi:hypothetical protein